MPNWCFNSEVIFSENRKDVEKFLEIFESSLTFEDVQKVEKTEDDFIFRYYSAFDLISCLKDKLKNQDIAIDGNCRGQIFTISRKIKNKNEYYYLELTSETAWKDFSGLDQVIDLLNKQKYFKQLYHCTRSEEDG